MLCAMKATLLAAFAALLTLPAYGAVRLPKIFSDHAVLQRDRPVHVWGWSEPGESVSVSLNGSGGSAVADRLGKWSVYLPPQPAGGPYKLTVNQTELNDIMLGDVWFASGQSNMEMPLSGFPNSAVVKNGEEEIRNSNNPKLRLLFIPHKTSSYPLADFDGKVAWTTCTPETAAKFSAVAYFFGRDIAEKESVTVGLIDSTWGGTPGEAWISLNGLSSDASLMPVFSTWAKMADGQADVPAMLNAEKAEDAAAKNASAPLPKHSWHPNPESYDPAWLYNGMVAPATGYGIKGVIWYQGETNSAEERAPLYHRVFSTLITDWRQQWKQGEFPFLFAQISSFSSTESEDWGVVRQAQLDTLSLVNTGMAVTIDVGDPDNVHPADKQTVGHRLALNARAIAYGESIEFAGPLFRQAVVEGNAIRVWFTHADGLTSKGGNLQTFEIAGADRKWVPATASIDGNSVVVKSAEIQNPQYVRYAWENAPTTANLFNAAGLPASTFTSE
jgi:sialate O-acetylesterase